MTKGKRAAGENNSRAKLTESIVYCLRVLNAHCCKPCFLDIAKEFGIHEYTIRYAITGDTWQKVPLYFKGQGYDKRMKAILRQI